MCVCLDARFWHRAALDASYRLASRLRAGASGVSAASPLTVYATDGSPSSTQQYTGPSTTQDSFDGTPEIADGSRSELSYAVLPEMDGSSQSTPRLPVSGPDDLVGDSSVHSRGESLSRRPVARSRLAEEILMSTFGTEDDASSRPASSDPYIAARNAYESRRKQLEEQHFGGEVSRAELVSTPLARETVTVQQRQIIRERLPTTGVGNQISHVREAQIVHGANKTPTLLT